jgi:hypothetical protein
VVSQSYCVDRTRRTSRWNGLVPLSLSLLAWAFPLLLCCYTLYRGYVHTPDCLSSCLLSLLGCCCCLAALYLGGLYLPLLLHSVASSVWLGSRVLAKPWVVRAASSTPGESTGAPLQLPAETFEELLLWCS